ncbi:MAG: hypothetical protein CM15mP85_22940 [Rhodobacterales bacterium]|nr:MAG: hypothetical protein CM15mP85_22940 [Rhodobacterales bacterium]
MSRVYLKKAQLTPKSNASEVHETVKIFLQISRVVVMQRLKNMRPNSISIKGI